MAIISLSFVISLGSLVWVYKFRQVPAVAAGQPPFLYLLCLGAAVCNSSAIFVSFDENMGYSEETLSQFCSVVPWLFVLGYVIIYCALVGKVRRAQFLFPCLVQTVFLLNPTLFFTVVAVANEQDIQQSSSTSKGTSLRSLVAIYYCTRLCDDPHFLACA